MQVEIGSVVLDVADDTVPVQGEAFAGGSQAGLALPCEARTPDGALLEIGLATWDSGEMDVRCFQRLAGPLSYDRLVKGVRLGVSGKRRGHWDCELGILTHHAERQPTMTKADLSVFDSILGSSASDLLMSLGALAVGTKELVIGDTGKRRSYLMMVSPEGDPVPPLAAYALTRLLPLMKGYGSSGAVPVGLA